MSQDDTDKLGDEGGRTRPRSKPRPSLTGEYEEAAAITREARFETLGTLGAGGMGVVEEVRDRLLDRVVARKTLRGELRERPESLEDFVREIRVTARLQHPGIVAVHDARLDEAKGPSLYMPRLQGRPLAQLIAEAHENEPEGLGADALADLVEVIVRACDAITYAHDEGVLHRDLKPDNIVVGHYGEVFVLDWGIALEQRSGAGARRSSGDSGFAGTPSYMAPEAAVGSGDGLDARADVYALGAVLYEIVTGRPPRDDDNSERFKVLMRHVALGESRARELEAGPGRPPELVRIIRRATAPEPKERHESIVQLRAELRRFLRGGGTLPRLAFAAGEAVVREGESGDAAYIIVEGRCRVLQEKDGETLIRRDLDPGDVFGETALLSPGPRTASVVALTDAVVLEVTDATLEREVSSLKPWLATLVRGLAARLREAEGR